MPNNILYVGCKPTFKNSVREEVIDISLASGGAASKIGSWRVSDEISMSDHRQITFELTDVMQEIRLWRNLRKTDWVGYEEKLTEKVKQLIERSSTALIPCGSALSDHMKTTAVSVVRRKVMARSGDLRSSLLRGRRSEDCTTSHTDRSPRPTGKLLRMPKRSTKRN